MTELDAKTIADFIILGEVLLDKKKKKANSSRPKPRKNNE